jgi:O-antigen/teichoic acid export membrane protein
MMGIYAFALTFVNLFDIFVNFGLERYIQREVGRQPDLAGPMFRQVFCLKVLIYFASAVIITVLSLIIVEPGLKRWVVWLLSASLFFKTNITSTNCFFRAHQQAKYEALVVISFRLVYGTTGLAAILSGQGLLTLAGLELVAQAGACSLAWWLFVKKIGNPFNRVNWRQLLELVKSTKEFLFIRVVLVVLVSLNVFMLSYMAGDLATGLYSAAFRLTSSFEFLPDAFTGAFLPELSRRLNEGWESFCQVFRHYFKYILIIGLGLAAVLGGMAEGFIGWIYGPAFIPAVNTLVILALVIPLDCVNLSLSNALISLDREKKVVWTILAAVALNFSLNLALIPGYRQDGAVAATLVTQIGVLLLHLRAIGLEPLRILGLWRVAARPLLAAALAWALARWLTFCQVNFFASLALMGVAFLLLLTLTGALSREEWRGAWQLIKLKGRELESA